MPRKPDHRLQWPLETASSEPGADWRQPGSNICLDFHGDPVAARLVVFSDGNHHMALGECIQRFMRTHHNVVDIFYATTPPSVLLTIMDSGRIALGNLSLARQPNVFIGPEPLLEKLHTDRRVAAPRAFARSRGNVFLVRKGNPLSIARPADLLRDDVQPFMSNPVTEAASYQVYVESLCTLADGDCRDALQKRFAQDSGRVCFGERIHHRELPQAIANGDADVGVVYFHLALRYTRIFPDLFDWVAFDGQPNDDDVRPGMVTTRYALATTEAPGEFGAAFVAFMLSPEAGEVYDSHGLTALGARISAHD